MATRAKSAGALLRLKIELAGIKPVVWRRVVVPESITLAKLHRVIQAVMGWTIPSARLLSPRHAPNWKRVWVE